jgi:hypothetical protein
MKKLFEKQEEKEGEEEKTTPAGTKWPAKRRAQER